MKAEHAAALKYIFQDEVYLLPNERSAHVPAVAAPAAPIVPIAEPVTEPVAIAAPVEPAPAPQPKAEPVVQTPASPFNYLGANKKAFLIFTHYPNQDFMDQQHLTALQSILKRKELELDDVAILNLAKTANTKWADMYRFFAPKKVLVLGQDAVPVGLKVPDMNQLKQAPAASLLYSFSFDEMMSSTDNKKAFWEQMKNL